MSVTKKDLEILGNLSLNSRSSLTQIAKGVKISKQRLSYRLKSLLEEKILLGNHAVVNTYALGQTHFRWFIKFHNMTIVQEKEFYSYIHDHAKVSWYAICDGKYDAAIIVWAKSIAEYEQVYREVTRLFGNFFRNTQFSIVTEINYFKHNFLTGTHDEKSLRFGVVSKEINLDELDDAIISELNKDARRNLVDIANKCNVSVKLVHDRISKLQQNKIILGFNTKIDHKKLGFTHRKVQVWLNDTSEKTIKRISGYLREQPSTIFTVFCIGGADLEFELMTKSNEEYYNIMKKFRNAFSELISDYGEFIIYDEPKSGLLN
ncbi:MAG: Lrp/AsnC family transcriptional regulator [Candidatus Woesearchaeota archaeon]|jgi:Lrp/AsnC family leucine-responsive transcriptional regulator